MNYALSIRSWNIKPHLDIEGDIAKQKNGNFTFTLRVNKGNIVDYNLTEYVNPRTKYGIIKAIIVSELIVAHDSGVGSTGEPVGDDNL